VRKIWFAIAGTTALLGAGLWLRPVASEINTVTEVAPGVFFHEGDLHGHGHCNNGWIEFDDYVLVVDANFPSGARVVIPKIRATTPKPIRFAFDTHHHGDHAYGNQVWVDEGAIPVAHTGVIEEMKKYETGHYGGKPGRWEDTAKSRPDVATSRLKPPTLLFPKELFFDDGKRRVELLHLGVAHTHGDGFAWLPKERILFTGDACVNGPYNYTGDGNTQEWVETLRRAQKLNPVKVVPGHGPVGDGTLLEDQKRFFQALHREVRNAKQSYRRPDEMQTRVEAIKANVLKDERIKGYVGNFFAAQVEKVYIELGGSPFPPKQAASRRARSLHAADHGLRAVSDAPKYARKER
jgi:cyclase